MGGLTISLSFVEYTDGLLCQVQAKLAMTFDPNDQRSVKLHFTEACDQTAMCYVTLSNWLVFDLPCQAIAQVDTG